MTSEANRDPAEIREAHKALAEAIALGVREGAIRGSAAAPVLDRLRRDPDARLDLDELFSRLGVERSVLDQLLRRVHPAPVTPPGPLFPSGVRQIAGDLVAADSRFGETLVREGAITREQLADALAGKKALESQGVAMRLGEVLVAKRVLAPEQVKQFLHLMDKQVLHCSKCGKNFNVKNWRPDAEVFCPNCSIALVPPPTDRTIDAHATRVVPPGGLAQEAPGPGKPFGRYRLLKKLGQGGMGVVWKAWDTQLKRVVALKQILVKGEEDRDQVERFMREAQLAAKLRHPHIIAVYDVGEHEGQHYFTSEYVAGQSLEEAMKGKATPKQMLSWTKDVAEALAYAHQQGVVHRDVKPGNVLVDGRRKPFVMDFGLAKEVDLTTKEGARKATLTAAGAVMGTPTYMSPEQASGQTTKVGPASDQFSLGVMLYQMMSGRLPFSGRGLGELLLSIMYREPIPLSRANRKVHRDVETICLKALEKDPRRRYRSMAEFAADLGRYLNGEPILARPASIVERLWRATKKRKSVLIPTAAAVILAVIATVSTAAAIVARRITKGGSSPDKTIVVERPATSSADASAHAADDKAKEGFDVVEAFRRENGRDPKKAGEVIAMYEGFLKQDEFKFSKWSGEARRRLEEYKKEVEGMAVEILGPVRKEAEALAAKDRFLAAAKAYDHLPSDLSFTQEFAKAVSEAEDLRRKAADRFQAGMKQAEDLLATFKYEEAGALLDALKADSDPTQLAQVEVLAAGIAAAAREHEAAVRDAALSAYDDFRRTLALALRARKFSDAQTSIERAMKDPVLATQTDALKLDLDEVGLYQAVFQDAESGARRLAETRQQVALQQLGESVSAEVVDGKVLFSVGGARFPFDERLLKTRDVEKLAQFALDPLRPETQLKLGLLWFYACDLDKEESVRGEEGKRARAALDAARKKDPRAARYCVWFDEAESALAGRRLLDKVKEAVARKDWVAADTALGALQRSFENTTFWRRHREEIDAVLKAAEGKLGLTEKGLRMVGKNDKGFEEYEYMLPDGRTSIRLISVPAAEFDMGSTAEEMSSTLKLALAEDPKTDPSTFSDEGPRHRVQLDAYLIGKTPITNAQYRAFCKAKGYMEPSEPTSGTGYSHYFTDPRYDNYPVVDVTWDYAKSFCEWAGLRLPTEAEWEHAARGTDGRRFPWGNDEPDAQRADFGKRENGGEYTHAERSHPKGESPIGALDMAGNVWQWCEDWYARYEVVGGGRNPVMRDGAGYTYRVVRGGCWLSTAQYLRAAMRSGESPSRWYSTLGIRVARSVFVPAGAAAKAPPPETVHVPDALVGTWRGTATQTGGNAALYEVVMEVNSSGGGTTIYPSLSSGGVLSGSPNKDGTVTYNETITRGRATLDHAGSIDGTITIRLLDDGRLSWLWTGIWKGEKVTASGALTKAGK